ncbi:unnamed protein product [Strongylus vulgaris]|uniref:Uncharacterized protein n=1 Tax=Strongylus vulgaris TaxID=40348 RepID=A0A3P7J4T0_STRVU|nr:unnamed protein product [Strongylus vulgaris]VDM81200.1 unnamed protein product [Strongylus vulgaris]
MTGGPRVCDNCSPATELTCPRTTLCDFTSLILSRNADQCSRYTCTEGEMYALIGSQPTVIDGAVCDRTSQLIWKTTDGQVVGRNLRATCALREFYSTYERN